MTSPPELIDPYSNARCRMWPCPRSCHVHRSFKMNVTIIDRKIAIGDAATTARLAWSTNPKRAPWLTPRPIAPTRRNFWNRRVTVAGRTTERGKPSEESISGGPSAGRLQPLLHVDRIQGARTRLQYHDLAGNLLRASATAYGETGTFSTVSKAARICASAEPSSSLSVSSGSSSGREGNTSLGSVTN